MSGRFFIFIFVFVAVFCSVTSAYTLENQYTLDKVGTNGELILTIYWDSQITKYNTTKLEFSGACMPLTAKYTSPVSVIGRLYNGAKQGYVNVSYRITNGQLNKWSPCEMDFFFSGMAGNNNVTSIYYYENSTLAFTGGFYVNRTANTSTGKPYAGIGESGNWVQGTYKLYSGTGDPLPVNFTGYPLDGYSPLSVLFTVQNYSEINANGTSWSFGDGNTGTSTISTINHTYQNPGIYTVSMSYYNTSGVHETITKNNYVLASIPTGLIVNLDVKNAITGALIQDSTVSIRNTTSGVWRNTTAPTGLVYFSTTDPGYLYPLSQNQSITLAANKSGYKAASTTFNIPYTNYRARLFLMPDNVGNATGTGNVVVNVIRNKDGLTVSGMSVVIDSGQIGVTNSAGAVTLFNVTAGARVVKVTDPDGAYQDTESSFTLVEGETKLIVVQVVLVGESPVTTYGTPVPTVTGTYDPDDPNSPGYGNYTATQVNQAGSEGIVQMLGQLIALWPLIVLGIFMKFMKSAFT